MKDCTVIMAPWYSLSVLVAATKSAAYEAALLKNHKVLTAHAVLGSLVFGLVPPLAPS